MTPLEKNHFLHCFYQNHFLMFALPFFLTSVEIVESVKEKKLITNGLLANQKWFWD